MTKKKDIVWDAFIFGLKVWFIMFVITFFFGLSTSCFTEPVKCETQIFIFGLFIELEPLIGVIAGLIYYFSKRKKA